MPKRSLNPGSGNTKKIEVLNQAVETMLAELSPLLLNRAASEFVSSGYITFIYPSNARDPQIDAHPVNNPTGVLARLQLLATVSNSLKNFRRRGAPRTCSFAC